MFSGLKEKTEKLVKKKMDGKDQLTPWEEFLEKKREKKKEKRKGTKVNVTQRRNHLGLLSFLLSHT